MSVYKVVGSMLWLCGLIVWMGVKRPLPAHAQSGCALRINEIMYHQQSGTVDEWVEFYVSTDIAVDTTYFVSDQENQVVNQFRKTFTLAAGTAAGTFVVVHNDGDPANDGTISANGAIDFYMGNGILNLNNTGDDIVLYQGADESGIACDYVAYGTGSAISGPPSGFSWDNSCPNPANSGTPNQSISLDPNGAESNSACDWAESGSNSPNDPGVPFTGGPHTQGYTNTIAPTAVSLASFSAAKPQSTQVGLSMAFVMMVALTGWGWFKRGK